MLRSLAFLLALAVSTVAAEVPELPREFRGAWVASVYNLNWPSRAGLPTVAQQSELRAILEKASELHLNALLLQVRPASDALYSSRMEPWSGFLTGASGRPPEPRWDPLEWAITEAHLRGIELHAWFNPFRAATGAGGEFAANHITHTHASWVRRFGSQSWIDPGEPAAREYVKSVIMDVVRRYDVDGVHIDDYFYPYPVKGKQAAPFPDTATYQRYTTGGGKLTLGDWRRDNINQFVESLYRSIKAEKRWVKFGISPFGIWRPTVPETTIAFVDSYEQLYADSRRWLNQGWCDYLAPQLYWAIDPPGQSFPVLLNWWRAQSTAGRHVWPGIATERIGAQRPAQEIIRQIGMTREVPVLPAGGNRVAGAQGGAPIADPGQIHWDMRSLMRDKGGIDALLRDKTYKSTAVVPASPWLGSDQPATPKLERRGRELKWRSAGSVPSRWWAVQTKIRGEWTLRLLPDAVTNTTADKDAEAIAVRAVDRFGNASGPAVERF